VTSPSRRDVFFGTVGGLCAIGVFWVALLLHTQVGRNSTNRRDSELKAIAEAQLQRPAAPQGPTGPVVSTTGRQSISEPLLDFQAGTEPVNHEKTLTLGQIAWRGRWPLCLAMVTYLPTYMTYPLFLHFETVGLGTFITGYIFYIDSAASFVGRQCTVLFPPLNNSFIAFLVSMVRACIGLGILFPVASHALDLGEAPFLAVFFFWGVTHGFLGTLPYRLADQCFTSAADKKQVGVLLQVVIASAVSITAAFNFTILPLIISGGGGAE